MGSIIERPRKDGGISYQAMVKVPGAKAAVKTFTDSAKAQEFINTFQAGRKEATLKRARRRKEAASPDEIATANQEEWMDEWLLTSLKLYAKSEHVSDRSKQSTNTIIKFGGDVKLGELNKRWVRDYISHAKKQKTHTGFYKWSTIVEHMRIVSAAMAYRAEELDAKGAKLPFTLKMVPADWAVKRERRLEPHEERAIVGRLVRKRTGSGVFLLRVVRLALNTAARLQELILAEWKEFDLERKLWVIPASHTKSKKTRRVPLNKQAMRVLRTMQLIKSPNSPRVFHGIGSAASASNMFTKMFDRLGIEDLRFHDLRHEAISRMVLKQRNKTVFELMEIVGHGSLEMLRRYTNLRDEEVAANWIE